MKLLTPTANRRWNEIIGVVWMAFGLLLFLSLASFSSVDRSFDAASSLNSVHNWVGIVGAYLSDLLYQVLGFCGLLLPVLCGVIGWQWFKSRPIESPRVKFAGAILLLLSLMSAIAGMPVLGRLHAAFPVGGLIGTLLESGLQHFLNGPGTAVFLGITLLLSVYMLTSFTMDVVTVRMKPLFNRLDSVRSRWVQWKEVRAKRAAEKKALKASIAASKIKADVRPVSPIQESVMESLAQVRSTPKPAKTVETSPVSLLDPVEIVIGEREEEPPVAIAHAPKKQTAPRASQTYSLPPTALLQPPLGPEPHAEEDLRRLAQMLVTKCDEFDVRGSVTQINPGPVVTTFEFKPEAGVKYSRVTNLTEDLCLAMEAESILIERIPGKSTVGIEVPNARRETIMLREIVESPAFASAASPLTLALGKEINGRIRVADLASMPHLLIAGSTGSGKSVAMNSLILSILLKATPDEVKMIMVDPKRLELGLYEGIPHLVTPIITDPKVAANALRNGVKEMERRLKLLAEKGVRNIDQYNKLFDKQESLNLFETPSEHKRLPYIVIFIDELADLMMVDSSNVEVSITRLAQMARAVGIHLVLATQRPSVDVITGLIKANFPARISFRVATKVDSRTILDANGAEALLGKGDMLFSPPGSGRLVRVHAPLVTEPEIAEVVDFWREQATPNYVEEFLKPPDQEEENGEEWTGEKDELYEDAVRIVIEMGKASTSTLQRRLRLGYGRAARLLDIMQKDGIIGPPDGSRPREVLKRPDWIAECEQTQAD